jgi:hypothetical protein
VILTFGFDAWAAAQVVLALLAGAAFLEAALGLCLGCRAFAMLMCLGSSPPKRASAAVSCGEAVPPASGPECRSGSTSGCDGKAVSRGPRNVSVS